MKHNEYEYYCFECEKNRNKDECYICKNETVYIGDIK